MRCWADFGSDETSPSFKKKKRQNIFFQENYAVYAPLLFLSLDKASKKNNHKKQVFKFRCEWQENAV